MSKPKSIIFGASQYGIMAYRNIKDEYDVINFCDNDKNKLGFKIEDIEIISPGDLKNINAKVIIASTYYDQISSQLFSMGQEDVYMYFHNSAFVNGNNYKYKIIKLRNNNWLYGLNYTQSYSLKNNIKEANNYNIKYKNNNVLIFSYIFPPQGGSGVQRTAKFVKYLYQKGYNPIVVTVGENFALSSIDSSMNNEIPDDISVIRIDDNYNLLETIEETKAQEIISIINGTLEDKKIVGEFWNYIKKDNFSNKRCFLFPDKYIGWCSDTLNKITEIVNITKIDYMFSSGGPFSTHLIPFYLKKEFNIPWVMDNRDEWTNNPYNYVNSNEIYINTTKQMESTLIKSADKLIVVNDISAKNYKIIFGIDSSKLTCISNGYDEKDFINIRINNCCQEKFTVIHNGIFYSDDREPLTFIQAVNELIEENQIDKDKFSIEFVGEQPNNVINNINNKDIYKIISIVPYMSHMASINNMSKSHMLLLLVGQGEKHKSVMPGKIFEYLRMKKYILALAPVDGVAAKIIKSTGSGQVVEMWDIYNIKQVILRQYNKYLNGGILEHINNIGVEEYERENLTNKLIKVFEEIS